MQYRGRNNRWNGRTARSAFTLVELLVVIAIIGILIALLLPAVQAAREAGRRTQCGSNMHQVALALLNYEQTHGIFPPGFLYDAGEFPHAIRTCRPNWIILILPQMDQRPIFQSFNFAAPISSPLNENGCDLDPVSGTWVARPKFGDGGRSATISSILCPSDNKNNRIPFQGTETNEAGNWARGNVACNAGGAYTGNAWYAGGGISCYQGDPNDGLWNGKSAPWKDPKWRGVMGPNDAEISLAGITDGTAYTILVGEIRSGISPQDRRGTWAMGGAAASCLARYGSNGDDNGPNFCGAAADDVLGGDKWTYDVAEVQRECMTMGSYCSWQQTVRSLHPGGVNLALGDASIHFVSNSIETSGEWGDGNRTLWAVWDRLILSADGLAVDNKKAGL